jgi:TPR repeat protein
LHVERRTISEASSTSPVKRGSTEPEADTTQGIPSSEFTRNGKAFVLAESYSAPKGKAVDVIRSLTADAERGDARAAFDIYLKLTSCHSRLNTKIDDEARERYRAAGIERSVMESAEGAFEDCSGLTPEQNRAAGRWLEAAADNGFLVAQLSYAANPDPVIGNASEMLRSPDAVKRYKAKAVQYLRSAASTGSVDALEALGNAYRSGILIDRDLTKGYAYYYAANLAYPSGQATQFLSRYAQALTADQVATGTRQGKEIYEQCCAP